jgi:hypothetical protein
MNRQAVIKVASVAGLAAAGAGCEWPWERAEAPSRIVERVQRAGVGDVRHASDQSLKQWFFARGELAVEINHMCAQRTMDTGTPGRTEARVCAAAAPVAFFHHTPRDRKGKSYDCCSR